MPAINCMCPVLIVVMSQLSVNKYCSKWIGCNKNCIKAQQCERNPMFIEPFAHSGFGLLHCCAIKHAYLKESPITVPGDVGSADKTTKHAWLATLYVLTGTYMYLQWRLCAWLWNSTYAKRDVFVSLEHKIIPRQGIVGYVENKGMWLYLY